MSYSAQVASERALALEFLEAGKTDPQAQTPQGHFSPTQAAQGKGEGMEPEKADIDSIKDPELRATLLRLKTLMDADTREPEPKQETAKVIQLPVWSESARGTPNSVLRGALFAAIQIKDRQQMKDELLYSH